MHCYRYYRYYVCKNKINRPPKVSLRESHYLFAPTLKRVFLNMEIEKNNLLVKNKSFVAFSVSVCNFGINRHILIDIISTFLPSNKYDIVVKIKMPSGYNKYVSCRYKI